MKRSGLLGAMALASFVAGAAAEVSVSPEYWDFGDVGPRTSARATFTVAARGERAAEIGALELDGARGFRLISSSCPSRLSVGETCAFSVEYVAADAGIFSGTVSVRSEDRAAETRLVAYTAPAVSAGLSFTPRRIDFGPVMGGTHQSRFLKLTNDSDRPVYIGAIESKFRVAFELIDNQCPMGETALPPRSSCLLGISFWPLDEGISATEFEVKFGPSVVTNTVYGDVFFAMGRDR